MEFLLRTNVGRSGFEEISEEYFEKLSEGFGCVYHAYQIEEKYDLVVGNYLEFETAVYETLLHHMVGRYPGWINHLEVQVTINRRVVNLLSSCRTYFDQIYRHLVLCFNGDRSSEQRLKEYANKLYDADMDYRLLEALRNHVQHHSLAVHGTRIGGKKVGPGDHPKVEYGVGFSVFKEEIAKNSGFKKRVLDEMPEQVDLVSAVRGYIKNINLVQLRVRALLGPRLESCQRTLLEAAGENSGKGGYLGAVALKVNESSVTEETVPLDHSFYEEVSKLREKNPARSKFDRGYFTGTPLTG